MAKLSWLFVLLLSFFMVSVSATPILQINAGQLTGAKNVNVDGIVYDVEFIDGTCETLFEGCDNQSDFSFTNKIKASLASHILRENIFIDTSTLFFDTHPEYTSGCLLISFYCRVLTPYQLMGETVLSSALINTPSLLSDNITSPLSLHFQEDISNDGGYVWARWTPAEQVPEPSLLAVLFVGLVVIGMINRRQNRFQKINGYAA